MRCPSCGAHVVALDVCPYCDTGLGPPPSADIQASAMAALRHAVRHGTDAELTAALEAWSLPDAAELVLEALELLLRLASSTSGHRASAALVAYDLVLPQLELAELAAPHLNPAERERLRKLRRWARRVADPAQAARDTRLGLVVFALLALGALAVVYGIGRLLLAWIEVRAAA